MASFGYYVPVEMSTGKQLLILIFLIIVIILVVVSVLNSRKREADRYASMVRDD